MNDTFKTGKLPARRDARTLKFARYASALAPPPATASWHLKVPNYPLDGNDRIGDCTLAGAAHLIETWTYSELPSTNVDFSEADCLSDYYALTGGPDTGLALLDVLRQWQGAGLKHGGAEDVITAYAELKAGDAGQAKQGIALFGGVYIGLELPGFVEGDVKGPWVVPPGGAVGPNAPNPNAGHCVVLVGYDTDWLYFVTWGAVVRMSFEFYAAYADEAYVCISTDWLGSGESPEGFNMAQLTADLAQIESQAPTPVPPQPPVPPAPKPSWLETLLIGLEDVVREIENEMSKV